MGKNTVGEEIVGLNPTDFNSIFTVLQVGQKGPVNLKKKMNAKL